MLTNSINALKTDFFCLQRQFHDRIAQLVYTFPDDAVTSTGTLFWSAPKRFPCVVDFDAADPAHASYAQAAAILRAEVYGIALPPWAHSAEKARHFFLDRGCRFVGPQCLTRFLTD